MRPLTREEVGKALDLDMRETIKGGNSHVEKLKRLMGLQPEESQRTTGEAS